MRSLQIVVDPPSLDDRTGMAVAAEQMLIEAFVPEPTVEAFHEAVLGFLKKLSVMPRPAGVSGELPSRQNIPHGKIVHAAPRLWWKGQGQYGRCRDNKLKLFLTQSTAPGSDGQYVPESPRRAFQVRANSSSRVPGRQVTDAALSGNSRSAWFSARHRRAMEAGREARRAPQSQLATRVATALPKKTGGLRTAVECRCDTIKISTTSTFVAGGRHGIAPKQGR